MIITAESLIYFLLFGANVCYKVTYYALLADVYCSGTGTGETRFFRICNEFWLVFILALDALLLLSLLALIKYRKVGQRYKLVLFGLYIIYIIFISKIWESPFFKTIIY
jgi:hypothetical protein